ncbi:hypothetical protein E8E11_008956 [Didymella keratinophila]|nr:hypothetical protein E8E11_008956 [Didymella keratinophila]
MGPGSELIVSRAVRAAQLTYNTGVTRAPLTPLRTPNGATGVSSQTAPVSPATALANCIKNEPKDRISSRQTGSPVARQSPPTDSTQTNLNVGLPSLAVQQAMSSPIELLDRKNSDVRPVGAAPLSAQVSPLSSTRFNLPTNVAQLARDTFAHSDTPIAPVKVEPGSIMSGTPPAPPPVQMVSEPAVQSSAGQRQQTSAACLKCRRRKVKCDGRTPTCSTCEKRRSACAYEGSPDGIPPQQDSVAAPHPNTLRPDCANAPDNLQPWIPKQEHRQPPMFHNEVEPEPSQPFDPGHFFNHLPFPEQDTQDQARPIDECIRDIIQQGSPESFSTHAAASADAQAWIQSIDKLVPQAQRKRTVVGVVGNTGAGKFSVVNAMLDKECLVPTKLAEMEFISQADREKEVAMLMKKFLTENGTLQREASNQSTDAGIAWAKFHSVHHKIARDELGDCTVANLMSDRGLKVLGITKKINTSEPYQFYQELQKYVDSKEKVTKKDKKDKGAAFEMEYWPLIIVVKTYTKAPALSAGAVIVDLPSVHDSNAARAAVAQGYIKQCTGLWIVAPDTRAVDDKAAKTLLGDSFRMQLKYDGGYSSAIFICSKTDDISITEAVNTLRLEDEVEGFYEEERKLEQETKEAQAKIKELKDAQHIYTLAGREAGEEIEAWEELKDKLDDGDEVYAPALESNKRKVSSERKSRNKHHANDEDSGADFVVEDDEASDFEDDDDDEDNEEVQEPREPLAGEDIRFKLKELRGTKKNARREGLELKPKIEELRPKVRGAQVKIKDIRAKISKICISGRNGYSKEAIQNDFAAGIKELDQENAAEEDEDDFNPDEEQRDYDQVAGSLPMFCMSSRAYQKMCGRLQKDDTVPGFETPEETEMPQLQAHCKKLTEAARVQNSRNFLLSVCQLLTTFTLWASNDGTGLKMTDDDKRKQAKYVERHLKELEEGLEACVKACLNVMKWEMNDQIFDKYPELIQEAIEAAPNTASTWGAHRNDGGLYWATYKAVVRRDGVYHLTSAGHRDFNSELVNPIVKKLATGWERAFQTRLPKAFANFVANSGKILHKSHEAVEERARQNGVGLASLSTLKTRIYTYEMLFGELNQILIESMTEQQREANRDFTPTIANTMHTVYEICRDLHGAGSSKHLKEAMSSYVERSRHHTFNVATITVKRHLEAMCRRLEETMEIRADEIFMKMKADYLRVLGGVQVNQEAVMSREERAMRNDIREKLRVADAQFEPISKSEVLPEIDAVNPKNPGIAEDYDERSAFDSAHESADEDTAAGWNEDSVTQDSILQENDDIGITEPSPGAAKQSKPPTPLSNEVTDEEL